MKNFLNELIHADSITRVLSENRKEAVKLAALMVLAMLIILFYLHQSSAELAVSDAASAEESAAAEQTQQAGTAEQTGQDGGAYTDENGVTYDAGGKVIDIDGIIYVDIGGAVKQPMLAELPYGSRVDDAIEAAGGLKKNADMSGINRAQVLQDGEKIYIPLEGEVPTRAKSFEEAGLGADYNGKTGSMDYKININTAGEDELQVLNGVGPATAKKIVDYREQNGGFKTIEDIKNVSGIGEKTYQKLEPDITVN